MVSGVNCGCDESGRFRVCSGNSQKVSSHNICLRSNGYQAVDVLADGHQHFASHVTTFLGSWRLVFDVYTRCTFLNEELCQLEDCCETSVSSISICHHRS